MYYGKKDWALEMYQCLQIVLYTKYTSVKEGNFFFRFELYQPLHKLWKEYIQYVLQLQPDTWVIIIVYYVPYHGSSQIWNN